MKILFILFVILLVFIKDFFYSNCNCKLECIGIDNNFYYFMLLLVLCFIYFMNGVYLLFFFINIFIVVYDVLFYIELMGSRVKENCFFFGR